MKKVAAVVLAAAGLFACGRGAEDREARSPERAPGAATAPLPQGVEPASLPQDVDVERVTMGRSLDADGKVASRADRFAAGEPIYISIRMDDVDRPSAVTLVWIAPDGHRMAEEETAVPPGAEQLTLRPMQTAGWRPGEYRLEVWAKGGRAFGRDFEIVPAGKATD